MSELIDKQAVINVLNVGAELLRRVLDDVDVVGVERAKYEWGLGLIESYIADIQELPPAQPEPKQIISETRAIPSDNDSYYSTLHERVAKCVSDLRDHFRLGYIVDPCGGIQALEITTKELMNY